MFFMSDLRAPLLLTTRFVGINEGREDEKKKEKKMEEKREKVKKGWL